MEVLAGPCMGRMETREPGPSPGSPGAPQPQHGPSDHCTAGSGGRSWRRSWRRRAELGLRAAHRADLPPAGEQAGEERPAQAHRGRRAPAHRQVQQIFILISYKYFF